MIIWLNGALAPIDEARIDPRDRGFLLGDGLFETLPAVSGRLFRLADHRARMARGAELLGLPAPPDQADLEDAALTVLAANGLAHDHAALRITYSRGPGPRGLLPPVDPSPTLLISVAPARPTTAPATAAVTAQRRNHLAPTSRIKCLGYLDNILARREADQAGADEGLMLNGVGDLACASAANLFMVEGGALLTPAIDHGALPGITRAVVMALAAANGIEAVEAAVTPERLAAAAEAFLTNSLIGVRPLVAVDGGTIGSGTPGPITRTIEEAYVATLRQ
ncbi:MAG: aminotransferase class IV [Alphaproteobacteria bacterium]